MQLLEFEMMAEALFLRHFGRDPKYRGRHFKSTIFAFLKADV